VGPVYCAPPRFTRAARHSLHAGKSQLRGPQTDVVGEHSSGRPGASRKRIDLEPNVDVSTSTQPLHAERQSAIAEKARVSRREPVRHIIETYIRTSRSAFNCQHFGRQMRNCRFTASAKQMPSYTYTPGTDSSQIRHRFVTRKPAQWPLSHILCFAAPARPCAMAKLP
jgi:hypothetical protein